jgi:hypothetical protein
MQVGDRGDIHYPLMGLILHPIEDRFLRILIYFRIGLQKTIKPIEVKPNLMPLLPIVFILQFLDSPISFATIYVVLFLPAT